MAERDISGITVDEVASLGADRLARMVLDHAWRDAALARQVELALAAQTAPDAAVERLRLAITDLRRDREFIDYRESRSFADGIDSLRATIMDTVVRDSPAAAASLLEDLIRLDEVVFERCDDSDGSVATVLAGAVEDWGRAWALVPERDVAALAQKVLALHLGNQYGVRDDMIAAAKDALGEGGLTALDLDLRQHLSAAAPGEANEPALDPKRTLLRALRDVADARGDVDAFIEGHVLAGTDRRFVEEIAERLISAGRPQEAISWLDKAWLDKASAPHAGRQDKIDTLRIDALMRLDRVADAQEVRWSAFTRTLSHDRFESYLAHATAEARDAAHAKAISVARAHRDVLSALGVLHRIDKAEAAAFVEARHADLSGGVYFVLRPAAEVLASDFPLAAVLLYRRMVDAVVESGQSKYYSYAAGDFVASDRAAAQVTDWRGHQDQATYRAELKSRHSRKRAFWSRVTEAEKRR